MVVVVDRAKAGNRALGTWLRRCRQYCVALKGGAYRKLMGMLVESVLLYGAEVWGAVGRFKQWSKYN